jgi:hypothetical protein
LLWVCGLLHTRLLTLMKAEEVPQPSLVMVLTVGLTLLVDLVMIIVWLSSIPCDMQNVL